LEEFVPLDKDVVKLFEVYRDYAKHEDNLSNFRITWFLAVQGLLFGGYAVLNRANFTSQTHSPPAIDNIVANASYPTFQITALLSFFGFVAALGSFISIQAAILAVKTLEKKWKHDVLKGREHQTLPALLGGGNRFAAISGPLFQVFLPFATMFIWPMILLFHLFIFRG
jgi:hypothetical protein